MEAPQGGPARLDHRRAAMSSARHSVHSRPGFTKTHLVKPAAGLILNTPRPHPRRRRPRPRPRPQAQATTAKAPKPRGEGKPKKGAPHGARRNHGRSHGSPEGERGSEANRQRPWGDAPWDVRAPDGPWPRCDDAHETQSHNRRRPWPGGIAHGVHPMGTGRAGQTKRVAGQRIGKHANASFACTPLLPT